jgi:hypothetical protein
MQVSQRTSGCARAPGQSREPGAQRCVEPLDVGGVENAKIGLGRAHELLSRCPGAQDEAARNGREPHPRLVFDDLHKGKLRPEFQARPSSSACVDWVPKDLAHRLRPTAKAIGHPQERCSGGDGSPHPFDDPLHQSGVALGAYLTPDEQPRENAHGRGNPDDSPLYLDPDFICLHLSCHKLPLTHQLLLYPLPMPSCSFLPVRHDPFIQPKRSHNRLHRTTVGQQRQHHDDQPVGIVQPEQRTPPCFSKRPLTHLATQSPLLLRVNPDVFRLPARRARHQAWIQGRFVSSQYFVV